MKLRKYQSEIVDYIESSIAFGSTRVIAEAPTGSGKSLMISELCKRFSADKVLILVNVSKLVMQISEHLDEVGVDHSILKSGMEDKFDEEKRVQIVMEQTYHSRKKKLVLNGSILIRDEHHIGYSGDRFSSLVREMDPRAIIGFSATPYDNYGVKIPGYELASFTSVKDLTEHHYLMPADTIVPKSGQFIDLQSIKTSADYSESELDNLLNNNEYNSSVVEAYKEHIGFKKTIVFVSGIEHAKDLAAEFSANGIQCEALHSKLSAKEQKQYMDEFRGVGLGEIDVLVTVSMLTTGFDMPSCNCVINCRPTKVRSLYEQMIGRVLRLDGDPLSRATIIDMCRGTTTHGLYDEKYEPKPTKEEAKLEAKRLRQPIIDYMLRDKPYIEVTSERCEDALEDVLIDKSGTYLKDNTNTSHSLIIIQTSKQKEI